MNALTTTRKASITVHIIRAANTITPTGGSSFWSWDCCSCLFSAPVPSAAPMSIVIFRAFLMSSMVTFVEFTQHSNSQNVFPCSCMNDFILIRLTLGRSLRSFSNWVFTASDISWNFLLFPSDSSLSHLIGMLFRLTSTVMFSFSLSSSTRPGKTKKWEHLRFCHLPSRNTIPTYIDGFRLAKHLKEFLSEC